MKENQQKKECVDGKREINVFFEKETERKLKMHKTREEL